jgi:hypothetical protein
VNEVTDCGKVSMQESPPRWVEPDFTEQAIKFVLKLKSGLNNGKYFLNIFNWREPGVGTGATTSPVRTREVKGSIANWRCSV